MRAEVYPAQALRSRAYTWALKLKVNPRVIRIQEMKHKWGSCSVAGTVTLASALLTESDRFQDYVVVHELLHLKHPAHGRLFKTLLSAYLPGWRHLKVGARSL